MVEMEIKIPDTDILRLINKTAIVTGSSRGIGRETAIHCVKKG